jgi:hypothetical protein
MAAPELTTNAAASEMNGTNLEDGKFQSSELNFHNGKSSRTPRQVTYQAAGYSRDHGSRDLTLIMPLCYRPACLINRP